MQLKIKKLREVKLPSYAHPGDAGLDLYAAESITLQPGEKVAIPSGVAVEIPDGYVGLLWDKSGLAIKHGIKVLGGVVDAGFRGEIMLGMMNLFDVPYTFEKDHKVCQMLIQKIEHAEITEFTELSETVRGTGQLGSTGK